MKDIGVDLVSYFGVVNDALSYSCTLFARADALIGLLARASRALQPTPAERGQHRSDRGQHRGRPNFQSDHAIWPPAF
ncbi:MULTISPECIES: hypothetical protein [unclassified Lysobacter]|uniref:hypothetical protein n=1 Tax=unclassified Lysobacter TaxID=2635362 RepID=UPI001BE64FC1|nr:MULTISPECIES: hypothetical protein [unclassified Lysobacter]MBT2750011.1 hypothetical protein [Lysobacter sp. ISL-50]MBT2775417.1 hypothetical protein [Lysobacter sp. ISL-54]MBT2783540.1 hypothetical protein [Lysobacter sp. ISL-52]